MKLRETLVSLDFSKFRLLMPMYWCIWSYGPFRQLNIAMFVYY